MVQRMGVMERAVKRIVCLAQPRMDSLLKLHHWAYLRSRCALRWNFGPVLLQGRFYSVLRGEMDILCWSFRVWALGIIRLICCVDFSRIEDTMPTRGILESILALAV